MITATGLELRAGARSCCPAPPSASARRPHRPRRPQRRRQDHHPARARRRGPAAGGTVDRAARSATCRRTRAPATWTCSPGPGAVRARPRRAAARPGEDPDRAGRAADDATRDAVVRRYGRLEERFAALGGYAAEAEAARICSNLGLPDRVLAQPLGTLSGGQRRRVELARILFSRRADAAARRADQPPRRRLDHLAARLPALARRRPRRDQPRRRPARRGRQQGLPPRRQPRRARRLQRGLEGLPASSARPTSGGASASGPTPRRRPPR